MTKFLRNEKGASIIEFALVGIVVFGLLFAIVDLGMMFFVNLTMQNAVREGARYAITGSSDASCGTVRDCVVAKIRNSSVGLCGKNPCNVTFVTLNPIPDDPNVGGPSELITIRVAYSWPLLTPLMKPFFPNGHYNFTVGATMRNEPFPGSGG